MGEPIAATSVEVHQAAAPVAAPQPPQPAAQPPQISPDAIAAADAQLIASFIEPKADLIYGASDSGKTTQVGFAVDYVLETYGKLSRLVTADGGGAPPGKAASGVLEVWTVSAWRDPIAAMKKAMRGYWPARLDDPEAPLIAPDDGTYEIYGLLALEGLTSFGDAILRNLKENRASLSQDPSYVYSEGGESFSGGNQSYYGFVQDNLCAWVAESHLLRFRKVLWTALEAKGEDQGQPVYGPSIAGRKAIGKATAWFKNSIHIDVVSKPPKEVTAPDGSKIMVSETERIMWLKSHADVLTKINYPAKVRVPAAFSSQLPPVMIPPDIKLVYRMIDDMEAKEAALTGGKMSEIAAVKERLLKAAAIAKERGEKAAMAKKVRSTMVVPTFVPTAPGGMPAMPQMPTMPKMPGAAHAAPAAPPAAAPQPTPGQVPTIQQVGAGGKK